MHPTEMHPQEQIPALVAANRSVAAAVARADADPDRPTFHFRPPANWMNDPNGTIYHNGYYHLFYQHNPYGDAWGHMHWGHARSIDLVTWEHLPIALWPSTDSGELHCFSGCATVNALGQPMLIYTSVGAGERGERPDNEQWTAVGSGDWVSWRKLNRNPILSLQTHSGPAFEGTWRDPYIFTAADGESTRTFLVLGGNIGARACVALYEAVHPALIDWQYRSILYEKPTAEIPFFECPNFLQVDGRWVLLISPYRAVEYFVGDFDLESLRFMPRRSGVLDPGANAIDDRCFYATNTAIAPDGRTILFGWIRGFPQGKGWNGCLALPRVLHIDEDGVLRQQPVEELKALRTSHVAIAGKTLERNERTLSLESNCIELALRLSLDKETNISITIGRGDDPVHVDIAGNEICVNGFSAPLPCFGECIDLHLYLDRSVLELFVAEGRLAFTQVVSTQSEDSVLTIASSGSDARILSGDLWHIKSIWQL